jgi:hypothetical protein
VKLFEIAHTRFPGAAVSADHFFTNDYVSRSHSWSMNGHTQSGDHWNVALGLVVRNSDFLGSLGVGLNRAKDLQMGLVHHVTSLERKEVARRFPLAAPPGPHPEKISPNVPTASRFNWSGESRRALKRP